MVPFNEIVNPSLPPLFPNGRAQAVRGPAAAAAFPRCSGRGLRRGSRESWSGDTVLAPRGFSEAVQIRGLPAEVHPGLPQALASPQGSGCPAVQRAEDAQAGAGLSLTVLLVYCSGCKL